MPRTDPAPRSLLPRWPLAAAALTLALAAAPAAAGADEAAATVADPANTLVLYIGDPDDEGLRASCEAVVRAHGRDEALLVRPLELYTFADARLWPLHHAVASCPAERSPFTLDDALAAADAALEQVDVAAALAALTPLDDALACVDGPVEGPALAHASRTLGYLRHLAGDADGARAAFGQAAVFDPEVRWDDNHPPQAQQAFNNGVLDALRQPESHLRGADGSWTLPLVQLDGASVPRYGTVRPGRHLVDVRTYDGGALRLAVDVDAGATMRFVGPETLIEALLLGSEHADLAGDRLAAQLTGEGRRDALVVDPSAGTLYRFDPALGQLVTLPRPAPRPPTRVAGPIDGAELRRPPLAGPLLVIAGATAAAIGLGVGLAERERALQIFDQVVAHPEQFDALEDSYRRAGQGMIAGYVIAGVGATAAGVGVPVWAAEARRARGTAAGDDDEPPGEAPAGAVDGFAGGGSAWLSLQLGPDGRGAPAGAIQLRGRW